MIEGTYLSQIACMLAIALGVAPIPNPHVPAVITAGTCGFGMGATPNAMANMQAICDKYAPSIKAYLLIPIVGSLFADFINSLVITFFINLV